MNIVRRHHVAVICSDYERSKDFYTRILGLEVVAEVHRAERYSYKLDLRLPEGVQIELFSCCVETLSGGGKEHEVVG